jgi:predicted transcriptional regulator
MRGCNTAQWARNDLREQGLIRDDTPRSIWEITEKGRRCLHERAGPATGR